MIEWLPFALLGTATLLWPPRSGIDARWRALTGTSRLAAAADVRVDRRPNLVPVGYAVVLAVSASVVFVSGVALAVAVLVAGAGLVRGGHGTARRRRELREARSLREAVRLIGAELNAGATVQAALSAGAGVGQPWRTDLLAAAGPPAGEATAGHIRSDPRLRPLFAALEVGTAAGAPLGEVLARVEADLAAAEARRREVSAVLAGPRSSALLLAVLPVIGVALGVAMGAGPVGVLFGTGAGRVLLCVGVALDISGLLWTHRLTRRAEPP